MAPKLAQQQEVRHHGVISGVGFGYPKWTPKVGPPQSAPFSFQLGEWGCESNHLEAWELQQVCSEGHVL